MSLSSTTQKIIYAGNGSNVTFAIPFTYFIASDVVVVLRDESVSPPTETTLVNPTNYGIVSTNIVMVTAPTSTQKLLVKRVVAHTQLDSFSPSGQFQASTVEAALDELTMSDQQMEEQITRSVRFKPTSPTANIYMPEPVANTVLQFAADGLSIISGPTVDQVAGATASATAAAASATSAAGSASSAATSATSATASATSAGTSATNAASSATAAASSATSAASSATTATNAVAGATNLATPSTLMKRDANANAVLNNLIENLSTTVTSGGTTTLVVSSSYNQQFTGTSNQTVVLPDATTMSLNQSFLFLNRSTGTLTVKSNGGATIQVMGPLITQASVICTSTATSAGVWDVSYAGAGAGTVTSASVVSANGFAGSVATATTTPAITVSTSVTGVLKGNGTAISAATSGTDYAPGTSGNTTGIVKSTTGTGALTTAVAADFPTLNQNTTGSAATATTATSATTAGSITGNLTGDTTSVGMATSIAAATVTGKAITGFVSGAGTVAATDTVLGAINKLDGNSALKAPIASPTFTGTVTAPTFVGALTGNASGSAASFTGSLVGDVGGTQGATVIGTNKVTNTQLAQMASHTYKGNNTAGTANALDLTATQLTAELNAVVGDSGSGGTKGLVPAPGSGDAGLGKYLKADGTFAVPPGGGAGGINYISNPDSESSTTGWATYSNTAQNIPVNGTAGTATGLTFSRSTSSPLRGAGSFLIVQTNSTSLQGKGVSYDFTADSADQAKTLQIGFDFNASSTFVAANGITAPLNDGTTSTNAGNSDIEVFIYDKTNSVLIPVSPQVITSNGSNNFTFKGTFQASSNSTSYRLIFHVATANANATGWSFKFDNVSVGPPKLVQGAPVTDWNTSLSFSPSGAWTGQSSANWQTRRVGDSLEVNGNFTYTGVAAVNMSFTLPSGYTIDTTKLSANTVELGDWYCNTSSATAANFNAGNTNNGPVFYDGSTNNSVWLGIQAKSSVINKNNSSGVIASAGTMAYRFTIPIAGWASTVQMSNDTDTRVVAASVSTTSQTVSTTDTTLVYTSVGYDTHGAYSTSNGRYTVPVSGIYTVKAGGLGPSYTYSQGNVVGKYTIYKNGVAGLTFAQNTSQSGGTSRTFISGTVDVQCIAGDYLEVKFQQTSSQTIDVGSTFYAQFERLTGPATIAATDSVAAKYITASGSTSTVAPMNFTVKDFDTHGAVTTGAAWKFTAPVAGTYCLAVVALSSTGSDFQLYKNGTVVNKLGTYSSSAWGSGTTLVRLLPGDYIDVRADTTSTLNSGGTISIYRTGN